MSGQKDDGGDCQSARKVGEEFGRIAARAAATYGGKAGATELGGFVGAIAGAAIGQLSPDHAAQVAGDIAEAMCKASKEAGTSEGTGADRETRTRHNLHGRAGLDN